MPNNPNQKIQVGVIAAAGKGTRAYPRSNFIPKPLFNFENKSLLERNVELQFRSLKVRELYIIVGHLREQVTAEVEKIRKKFPGRTIHTAPWTGHGLAADIASLRDFIPGDFSVILGDEFYHHTNHEQLLVTWAQKKKRQAVIAILESERLSDIRKNYSVELQKDRILKLVEKPEHPPNNLLGLGTYLFSHDFFTHFDQTPPSKRSGVIELTDVIDKMARETKAVYVSVLKGRYFNINSLADYYTANYLLRSEKFKKYRISLVIPTRNNESSLPDVLGDFAPFVHEILVMDMGSDDKTLAVAKKARVRTLRADPDETDLQTAAIHNARAVYRAMHECKGDIILLAPADGSFRARDLPKLLEYLKDCDMVVGTRTTRQMIEQGSNLIALYRWLNVLFGKVVEILWWDQEPRFTDIGCIYRAIWKDAFEKIRPDLRATDKTYSVEMMIEIMRYHMRCIEIPVSYYKRYSELQNESRRDLWRYFFSVLRLIFSRRLGRGDKPSEKS